MNKPILQKVKNSDTKSIASVSCIAMQRNASYSFVYQNGQCEEQQKLYFQNLLKYPQHDSQHIIVAKHEGQIIGYMHCWQKNSDTYFIEELYAVKNDCHAGTFMLSHAALFAESKGMTRIELESCVDSVEFYEQYDFVDMGLDITKGTHKMYLDLENADKLKPNNHCKAA